MFVYLKYLQVHNVFSKYEGYDENTIDGVGFVDIDRLLYIDGNGPFSFDGVHNDEFENSSTQIWKSFRFYGTCTKHQCKKFIPCICLWIICFNVKGKVEATITTLTPIFKIHFQN